MKFADQLSVEVEGDGDAWIFFIKPIFDGQDSEIVCLPEPIIGFPKVVERRHNHSASYHVVNVLPACSFMLFS